MTDNTGKAVERTLRLMRKGDARIHVSVGSGVPPISVNLF